MALSIKVRAVVGGGRASGAGRAERGGRAILRASYTGDESGAGVNWARRAWLLHLLHNRRVEIKDLVLLLGLQCIQWRVEGRERRERKGEYPKNILSSLGGIARFRFLIHMALMQIQKTALEMAWGRR